MARCGHGSERFIGGGVCALAPVNSLLLPELFGRTLRNADQVWNDEQLLENLERADVLRISLGVGLVQSRRSPAIHWVQLSSRPGPNVSAWKPL